jgi:hypothetical protein
MSLYPFFIEYGHGEKLPIKIEGEETKINKLIFHNFISIYTIYKA